MSEVTARHRQDEYSREKNCDHLSSLCLLQTGTELDGMAIVEHHMESMLRHNRPTPIIVGTSSRHCF